MPRFLLPKRSTPHRVAAIALYRALLSRCVSAPLPDEDRSALHNAIRNKFRKNRRIQSPYQLGLSFRAGYEAVVQFDAAANGSTTSTTLLRSLISTLPRGLTRSPPSRRPPRVRSALSKQLACLPPEKALLNVRPYANVSGPRHVPILASANSIPFLRIKKPQPSSLSRIIQVKLKGRIRRFHNRTVLANYWLPFATHEDRWDELIEELGVVGQDQGRSDIGWAYEVRRAVRAYDMTYERETAGDRKVATRMQEIVDQETVLALREGQTITRGRKHRPISITK
ncbi:hypothetical protein BDV95DRAFT_552143 [Massariosphaeria phaeospora]|uniref:Complex 1 LYR protein domain-containing protein n=1 Tax=Massariosphaeria phaeospora TaxID=100035 RepID=A0A7C8I1H0_9PLEO|nr:hypothetical protein BDV95DRAFT_552143 [Massariosphaeria phaeospora]